MRRRRPARRENSRDFFLGSQAHAAEPHRPFWRIPLWADTLMDGPSYITSSGDGRYVDCGRPGVPEGGPGPIPNSAFRGPVGYRCIHGIAWDPFYPPRCKFAFVKHPEGWIRILLLLS